MKILVTGASGFIGSYIVEEALRQGMETWAAVRPTSSRKYLQDERIHFINLNLSSEEELEDSAFAVHPFLKRVVMPDNPKLHVMKHIFDGSPNLESIYFRSKTPPRLGNAIWKVTMDDIFKPLSFGKVILYVPQGSKDAYRRSPWGRFVYIVEFEK